MDNQTKCDHDNCGTCPHRDATVSPYESDCGLAALVVDVYDAERDEVVTLDRDATVYRAVCDASPEGDRFNPHAVAIAARDAADDDDPGVFMTAAAAERAASDWLYDDDRCME